MGNLKGHALPGSFFLISGVWWAAKFSFCYTTHRNKGAGITATKAMQRRLEVIEGSVLLSFALIGIMAEQFVAGAPSASL
ncbi:hypothetical protein AAFF_G00278280 [Aldrovandia affinis]|uniref:Uncharacterized protein n=1 Tax=Aldrovandia affinis TaxID=143900 RepID=A0AAD7SR08_9TELE|nr:hypothetical protein AAFF_G00278280 [Aldrovandia affinis]